MYEPGIAWPQPRKRAKQTARDADVGRFDADVVVVVRQIAMPPFALAIGERRDVEQVGMLEQPHAIFERQAFAPLELPAILGDIIAIVSQTNP